MQTQHKIERDTSPNASQLHAIQTTECPLLIIAGPGSGKTFTLVERAFYLIAEKNVLPDNILISTFTEKAAREIITRLSNRLLENNLDVNLHEMYIGTLHSIFLRILEENKEATQRRDNLVFDDFDQKFFVYNHIWDFKIKFPAIPIFQRQRSNWQMALELVRLFNICTEEALKPDKLIASENAAVSDLGKAYQEYLNLISNENAYDFSNGLKQPNGFFFKIYSLASFYPLGFLIRWKKNIRDLVNILFHFLKQGGINEYEDEEEYAPSGCVSFLTIHQAKGMEFPIVCVGSLNTSPKKNYNEFDVLIQNYYRKQPFEPIEKIKYFDFRRLFYTAFSRAQNLLVLTDVEKGGKGKTPSKHFDESYSQTIEWKAADLNPDMIRLKPIRDVNIKKEYSFSSHINLFETCPRQYQFLQHLEFSPSRRGSMLFGTLVHQSIEDIHKQVLKNGVNGLHEAQIKDWFETNYKMLSTREKQFLSEDVKQAAQRQVINYFQRNLNELEKVREAEVSVSLVKKDYILKGTIDLIKGKGDTVEIIDFKSEAKPDVTDIQSYQRYQKQLETYAHIVEERHGLHVSQMHLYYTGEGNGNPLITFEKNQRHVDQTMQEFDRIVNRIENRDFQISQRTKRICRSCDLRFYCDFKGCDR